MAASFTHPLTGERKIMFPEHIRDAESLVLSLAFVVFGVGCYSRHDLCLMISGQAVLKVMLMKRTLGILIWQHQ